MKRLTLFQIYLTIYCCVLSTFQVYANDDFAHSLTPLAFFKQQNIAINDITTLPNGASLIASQQGLYLFTEKELIKASDPILQRLDSSSIKALARVENHLFLASDNQLFEYDLENQTLNTLVDAHVEKLKGMQQYLYFIRKGNLFRSQPNSQESENLTFNLPDLILDYQVVSKNTFWLTTSSNKLINIDQNQKITQQFELTSPISFLYNDRKNRLWFTQNNMLFFIAPNAPEMTEVSLTFPVESVTPLGDSSLILQSQGNLYLFQLDTRQIKNLGMSLISHNYSFDNKVLLLKHQNNNWFLTSLNHLNLTSQRLSQLFSKDLAQHSFQQIQWQGEYLYLKNQHGLWRYQLATKQLSQLIKHRNIEQYYLNNQGEIWFSDAQFIYTFDLITHQQHTKFPFKNTVALVGDKQSPPFIVTTRGIYRNSGDVTYALFNSPTKLADISFASFYKGTFFLSSDTGFWQIEKQGDIWQTKRLLKNAITYFSHQHGGNIWLKTAYQTLLFDADFGHVVSHFNTAGLLNSDYDFYHNQQHHFVSGDNVISYPFDSHQAITPLQGLKISGVHLNNDFQNIVTNNIKLSEKETQVSLSFYDTDIPHHGLALNYRFSPNMDWISLPQGQNTISFFVASNSLNKLTVVNRNDLQQQPIEITFSHHYAAFNGWIISTFILTSVLILLSFLWWFKHRKDAQYGLTSALLAQTQEAIWICDETLKVLNVNQTFQTLTGFTEADVFGKQMKVFDGKSRNLKLEQIITHAILEKGSWSGELWSKRKNGSLMALSLNVTKIRLASKMGFDTKIHYVGMFKDITQQKQQEKQLRDLATRDQVTGLLNRTVFIEQLILAINASSSNQPEFCVLIVNLDNFYKINDGLGHSYGDRVLKMAAQRLEQSLPPNYTLASLGGDEFGILLPPHVFKPLNIFNIKRLCEKLLLELSRTMLLDDLELCLSASIGAAIYPDNGFDSESILRSADSALQHAKVNGKNTFQIFNRAVKTHSPASLSIENEINRAIIDKEFTLYYQPKFNTRTNQVCGVEALARWPDGNNEVRSPAQFISVAEANNAIIPLTRVLIEVCCRQIKEWQAEGVEINGRIALNLSAIHFQRADLIEDLTNYLQKYQISGDCMELEITESVMMNDPEFALQQMHKLKRLGFTIALDDFGTGHSSLSYLKKFPIDRLKIDRSFVVDIEHSEQDRNITATIIRLAKYLNIDVVAEGVETEAQSYFLHVMGCDVVQGYFFSKPLPSVQLEKFIEQTKVLANYPKSN